MPPSVGYAIADVATLTAIGSGDRDDGYARLLLNDGNGRRFWVAYDDTATSGDYQPDDTPATGYWKKVEAASLSGANYQIDNTIGVSSGTGSNPIDLSASYEIVYNDVISDPDSLLNSAGQVQETGTYSFYGQWQFTNPGDSRQTVIEECVYWLRIYESDNSTIRRTIVGMTNFVDGQSGFNGRGANLTVPFLELSADEYLKGVVAGWDNNSSNVYFLDIEVTYMYLVKL